MQNFFSFLVFLVLFSGIEGITEPNRGTDEVCSMRPDRQIPSLSVSGLQRTMANIYNEKGKYLEDSADEMEVEVPDLAAVVKVESGGNGFSSSTGLMIIRFENHVFYSRYTNSGADVDRVAIFNNHFRFDSVERWKGHEWRRSTSDPWQTFHGDQTKEWEVLQFSQGLDDTAALLSISMGAAQIMGFNHQKIGFSSVQEMFLNFSSSLELQLDGMFSFIENSPNCISGLKQRDYVLFASCYNGAGQASSYGALIQEASIAYSQVVNLVSCTANDLTGQCLDVGDCQGNTTAGLCPGPASIQCCTDSGKYYGACNVSSNEGECIDTGLCIGVSHSGFCPGPSNIRCCIPNECRKTEGTTGNTDENQEENDSNSSSIAFSLLLMFCFVFYSLV